MVVESAVVSTLTPFHGLSAEQLAWVTSQLHHKVVPVGTSLITAEQPGEAVYFLVRGTAKIYVTLEDGRDVILSVVGHHEVVGEMSLVDDLGRSANVRTLEECEVLWMDRRSFQHGTRTMPEFTENLLRILSRRIRVSNARLQALATLDVEGRVARQLLAFAAEYGVVGPRGEQTIPLRLTQSDLADLVGASRARVNHAMATYQRHGYISVSPRHYIIIHDREPLARRCRGGT